MSSNETYSYKVVVLGYYSVGKSSIINKYVKNIFNPNEESTIGAAFLTKSTEYQGHKLKFEIWDTAGQERYNSLIPMYYRGAQVALIVYDITSKDSFECAQKWVQELSEEKPKDFVKVLIGNKNDLSKQRTISVEEALDFANQNSLLFFESSAKTGFNIERIFNQIADIVPKQNVKKSVSINVTGSKKNFGCC